ncbi:hypothetical protein ACJMK2_007514, partial [Sinanodonta woodiana]
MLPATTDSETVWLKDVTGRFQTEKRTLSYPGLPDQLSFHIKGESHNVILNLERNHEMDPNADIYIVEKLDDGRSHLVKTETLETEDVAYYQDRDNGAFVTARCVKSLNGQCDISINGNIRIGGINYDLQPSEDDMSSIHLSEMMDVGKRYVLRDHPNIERKMSEESKHENVEENLRDFLRVLDAEDKHNNFYRPDLTGSRLNFAGLHNKGSPGDDVSGIDNKDGELRNLKRKYHVKTLVLADSTIWDLFLTTVRASVESTKRDAKALKNTRRYLSHIMNGVNQLYRGIGDPEIEINVYIRAFLVFPWMANFPHFISKVQHVNGTKMIDANYYITDLGNWDLSPKEHLKLPDYDQVILITRYEMYRGNITNLRIGGLSIGPHVCVPGYRVQIVRMGDYFWTMSSTAHELGHNLGAAHDGEGDATDCKAEDQFIMSPALPVFVEGKAYSRNPWLFSNCSVNAFKRTLRNKDCVTKTPNFATHELDEFNKFVSRLPGEKYSASVQCHLINGPGSRYCEE